MLVRNTGFTIAEYCSQMKDGAILVNRDYQRTATVWPPSARSYLIDTILLGYPIPKISLYQKTDLEMRKTVKEIVDGQQRSTAILDFFDDKLRITGKSKYSGQRFSDLEEDAQKTFVEYQLSVDLIVAADDNDIRQMFRRINSYTVPLNPEEQRHATHQGVFKWFIVGITEVYAPTLKRIEVFSERDLSRMKDAKLFTELVLARERGIETYSRAKLNKLYADHNTAFVEDDEVKRELDLGFERILSWEDLHRVILLKPYNFYALMLAVIHSCQPIEALQKAHPVSIPGIAVDDVVLGRLGELAGALEVEKPPANMQNFVNACIKATNTEKHRKERFSSFCRALQAE